MRSLIYLVRWALRRILCLSVLTLGLSSASTWCFPCNRDSVLGMEHGGVHLPQSIPHHQPRQFPIMVHFPIQVTFYFLWVEISAPFQLQAFYWKTNLLKLLSFHQSHIQSYFPKGWKLTCHGKEWRSTMTSYDLKSGFSQFHLIRLDSDLIIHEILCLLTFQNFIYSSEHS